MGNKDYAILDGKKAISVDKLITLISFILLLIIVVIPIFMIVFNTFFSQTGNTWKFELSMFIRQMTDTKNLAAMWNTIVIAFFATIF